jgi:MSHA biogenesis protein MshN
MAHRLISSLLACMLLISPLAFAGAPQTTGAAFSDLTAPLEIVVERDRSRVAAAKRLARLYVAAGRWDDALRVLELSAPFAMKDAEYQGFAGTVLRQLKRAPEAAEAYRRAIALQPGEGRWGVGLGMALQDSGRNMEAKEAFTAAREREQTLSPALMKFAEKRSR